MPIYPYKCRSCGHAKDVLQKISDEPQKICPSCGEESWSKQLSAPGFQLKGTGWYATDFKNAGEKAPSTTPANSETTAPKEVESKTANAGGASALDSAGASPSNAPASGQSTEGGASNSSNSASTSTSSNSSQPSPSVATSFASSSPGCGASCSCH
jgi:putative FmdB family regulatory protein